MKQTHPPNNKTNFILWMKSTILQTIKLWNYNIERFHAHKLKGIVAYSIT